MSFALRFDFLCCCFVSVYCTIHLKVVSFLFYIMHSTSCSISLVSGVPLGDLLRLLKLEPSGERYWSAHFSFSSS